MGESMTPRFDEKWDRRYLDMARLVSAWSKDPSTKVGAVIVDDLGRVVGTGYNGLPRGVEDTEERLNDRSTKYAMVVHAELNALLQAGERARGATIYVYPGFASPCVCQECAKAVIQSGVKRIVGLVLERDSERVDRWKDSLKTAQTMCDEAGVRTHQYQEKVDVKS